MSSYEENIRFLLINKPDITQKTNLYKSKYPGNLPPTYSTFGFPIGTLNKIKNPAGKFEVKQRCFQGNSKNAMGPAKGDVKKTIDPKNFLKKGERIKKSEEQAKSQHNKRSENKD
ncbi:hypothetical protein TTHERM_000442779 (macronuclear) [Tetrahymena thermophila SB210]|uniref:Uncharacterized protein n=1 Tax=Tetrahymena thermophila (strain SB210) TaxID=312017 RepID=W7XJA9_TETTS|nr:hypothetical protein TTHERM_000442779 [Tetrahymena thermophila SB210]EWS74004.1 hypothetical protein TTHERM_000442779 [Tetrahymena thermophila SB210]|eukprot:XP_012653466.1 hypothetical protein TTHERM_000442779 [Tetrahymena thermophila SB210]